MRELIDAALELSETYPVFPCDIKKRLICAVFNVKDFSFYGDSKDEF